jgi:23S rRNA pseudouridine955/2504/2580 synthase
MKTSSTEQKNSAYFLPITEEQAGQRLDNFLTRLLKSVPKTHVYRLIRTGAVRVNKGRKKPDYKLQAEDAVRIPPVHTATEKTKPVRLYQNVGQSLLDTVLYEDEYLLIINKPAGLAVHGGSGIQVGVIEALRQIHPRGEQLELVHRIDRETSGCLMIAKRRAALRGLHEQLRTGHQLQKKYRCLVQGQWPGAHTLEYPLLKNTLQSGERIVRVDANGQASKTRFSLLKSYPNASLMEAQPITGRTHQIRVHAAHAKHPIAGDEKYGSPEFNKYMRKQGLNRLFLHAHELQLTLPYNGKKLRVIAPLDSALTQFLKSITPEESA